MPPFVKGGGGISFTLALAGLFNIRQKDKMKVNLIIVKVSWRREGWIKRLGPFLPDC